MNVGVAEGHARTALGVVSLFASSVVVARTHGLSWPAWAAMGLALMLLMTGSVRSCPVYRVLGLSTVRPRT